jgi:hypothetical protein
VLDVDEFVAAVRRVAGGGTAIDPLIVSALVGVGQPAGPLESLSSREMSVLQLMAEGLTNTAMATKLCVPPAESRRQRRRAPRRGVGAQAVQLAAPSWCIMARLSNPLQPSIRSPSSPRT